MAISTRGMLAGIIGGLAVSAAMSGGRKSGVLDKTLAEKSADWIDERFDTDKRLGEAGTMTVEQGNHLASSAAFGLGYAAAKPHLGRLNWTIAGSVYGALLYAINVAGLAPLLGVTIGELSAPPKVAGQRLGMHVLFGTATAFLYDKFERGPRPG